MGDCQTLPQDYPRTDGHSFQTDLGGRWYGEGVGVKGQLSPLTFMWAPG